MKGNNGFKTYHHSGTDEQTRSALALVLATSTPEYNHLPFFMPFMSFMLKAFVLRPCNDARCNHRLKGVA